MTKSISTGSRVNVTVALCFAVALVEGFDLQSAGVAAGGMRVAFDLNPPMLGWMFSASIIGLLPGAALGGWLADRIGRKKVLLGAVMLFGIFSIGTAYSSGYSLLLLARFMTGLGLGAALPTLIALCAESVAEHNRSIAVSSMYCGVPLGGMIAALIAVAWPQSWQSIFIAGGTAPLLIMPLLSFLLPESNAFRQRETLIDAHQMMRVSTFNTLLGSSRYCITLLLWLSFFFTLTVMYMLLNWLPLLLREQGFTQAEAGAVQMLFNLGGALGSIGTGYLLDRWRRLPVVMMVYGGLLCSLAGLGLATGINAMLCAGLLAGLFILGAQLVLYALAPIFYPTEVRATGVGAAVSVGRLGSIAGPLAAGKLLATGAGVVGVLAACAPGIVIAAIATAMLLHKHRGHRPNRACDTWTQGQPSTSHSLCNRSSAPTATNV